MPINQSLYSKCFDYLSLVYFKNCSKWSLIDDPYEIYRVSYNINGRVFVVRVVLIIIGGKSAFCLRAISRNFVQVSSVEMWKSFAWHRLLAMRWDFWDPNSQILRDVRFIFSRKIPKGKSHKIPNARNWDLFLSKTTNCIISRKIPEFILTAWRLTNSAHRNSVNNTSSFDHY